MRSQLDVRQEISAKPPGIIDTIGTAFALLSARPYLIWPPVVLDLYLWLGTRVSVEPLASVLATWVKAHGDSGDQAVQQLQTLGTQYNLFDLLGVIMPSLVKGLNANATAGVSPNWIIGLSWPALVALAGLMLALGGLLGIGYLTVVGYLVGSQSIQPLPLMRSALRNFWHLAGFLLVAIGITVLLALPLLVLTGALLVLGINVLAFTEFVMMVGVLCLLLLLYFAQDAIVVSGAGPLDAVYLSYNVVRRFFWPTVGFVFISTIVGSGVPAAMSLFTHSPWSMPFALVGHAFVATGMIAASMLFYRDRVELLSSPASLSERRFS